jgi:Domain of unknown function (DUF4282)
MEPGPSQGDAGIGALFDFGFKKFITLGVIKVLYILGMAVIALILIIALIGSLTQGVLAIVGVLVVGPLIAGLYLIFFRIWLELVVVIFRIGENTSKLVEQRGGTPPMAGGLQ